MLRNHRRSLLQQKKSHLSAAGTIAPGQNYGS
ncbi:hypothetical protein EM595_3221 [Duffyella gerundensis]|uniref:Uncharacterized protein n=1 Tax=Duffyella gerundensis TaxID=1619313 RepID=A0A0U5LSU1_9GAMM|nr:hypothetical protein EM595_3221 [Duffyella gerundensis]